MDTQLLENAEVNAKLTVLQTQAQFSVKPCSTVDRRCNNNNNNERSTTGIIYSVAHLSQCFPYSIMLLRANMNQRLSYSVNGIESSTHMKTAEP